MTREDKYLDYYQRLKEVDELLACRFLCLVIDSSEPFQKIEVRARTAMKLRDKQVRKDQLDKWGY